MSCTRTVMPSCTSRLYRHAETPRRAHDHDLDGRVGRPFGAGGIARACLEQPDVERRGSFTRARGPNLALLEWALPEGESLDSMRAVKTCNPATWIGEPELAEQREAVHEMALAIPREPLGDHRGLRHHTPRVGPVRTRQRRDPRGPAGVTVGVDIGLKWDTSALVPVARPERGEPIVPPADVLEPPRDGSAMPVEDIINSCELLAERWPQPTFVLDRKARRVRGAAVGGEAAGRAHHDSPNAERDVPCL